MAASSAYIATDAVFIGVEIMQGNRLKACAEYVSGKGKLVDVGTDHGYLPCFLVENGICKSAVAADINDGPLSSAKENIKNAGLEDKIETVLSDGLDRIKSGGVSDVVIAGMGGELIAQILQRAGDFLQANFILQPMTKIDYLRRYLWENGFEIISETACRDEFYYTVMQARYTGEKKSYTELQTYIGKMKANTDDEKGFLLRQAYMLEKKGRGIMQSQGREEEAEAYLELSRQITDYANGDNREG